MIQSNAEVLRCDDCKENKYTMKIMRRGVAVAPEIISTQLYVHFEEGAGIRAEIFRLRLLSSNYNQINYDIIYAYIM